MADEGFDGLIRDLTVTGEVTRKQVRDVVFRGAQNVKRDAQAIVKQSRHFRRYPYVIDFDFTASGDAFEAAIGPNPDKTQPTKQPGRPGTVGRLDNLLEYGSSTFGPLRPHMGPALDAEGPRFVKAMEDLAKGLL